MIIAPLSSFPEKNISSMYGKYVVALPLIHGELSVDSNFPIKMFPYDDTSFYLELIDAVENEIIKSS